MTTSIKPLHSIAFPARARSIARPGMSCWNLFDLAPEGRGSGWYPRLSYR